MNFYTSTFLFFIVLMLLLWVIESYRTRKAHRPTKRAADFCQVCGSPYLKWDDVSHSYICHVCGKSR